MATQRTGATILYGVPRKELPGNVVVLDDFRPKPTLKDRRAELAARQCWAIAREHDPDLPEWDDLGSASVISDEQYIALLRAMMPEDAS